MSGNPLSILDSVKKFLGLDSTFTDFDLDITLGINSAFGFLHDLNVGPDEGFQIEDDTTLWSDYTTELLLIGMIKLYVILTVRLAFDPPATSFGLEATSKQIDELAWRILSTAEHIDPPSNPFQLS